MRSNWISIFGAVGLLTGLSLVGCKTGTTDPNASQAPAPKTAAAPKVNFGTDVGIPLDPQTDSATQLHNLYAQLDVRPRQDPFSLTPQEIAYDKAQQSERLVQQEGQLAPMFEVPPPPDDTPPYEEPQPYRRVSGILVGDSVLAIIEMGEGAPVIVRPGMYVPNTPWFVVSIDEEKVVLRRQGAVNPKEITIRLEQRPPNMGGGGAGLGGAAQGGGAAGSGRPTMGGVSGAGGGGGGAAQGGSN